MESFQDSSRSPVLLSETSALCGSLPVHYQLWALPREGGAVFTVSVEFDGTRETGVLGQDPERATHLFGELVRGTVTPCTLQDILLDAQPECP